jgi:hypothetical protein
MASFYADEQFPKATTIVLRSLGHDVLTVQEAGTDSGLSGCSRLKPKA